MHADRREYVGARSGQRRRAPAAFAVVGARANTSARSGSNFSTSRWQCVSNNTISALS
jgi:hypothetical protein